MRIAQIGIGRWGLNITKTLMTFKDVILEVYDVSSNLTNAFREEIDIVVISTPPKTHFKLARRSLLSGHDTYVEKPIALVKEDVEELIDLAQIKDCILMEGLLLLYMKCYKKVPSGVVQHLDIVRTSKCNYAEGVDALWTHGSHIASLIALYNPVHYEVDLKEGVEETTRTTMVTTSETAHFINEVAQDDNPLLSEMKALLRACRTRKEPLSGPTMIRKTFKVLKELRANG